MSISEARLTAYEALSDEELSALARQGSRDAEEILVKRYTRLVRQLSRPYYLAGGDSDDLIQEGMIGLMCGVREYDEGKPAPYRRAGPARGPPRPAAPPPASRPPPAPGRP